MKNILVMVDMQRNFIDGTFGTKEAKAIVKNVAQKIRAFEGELFVTYATHFADCLSTSQGRRPVHGYVHGLTRCRARASRPKRIRLH